MPVPLLIARARALLPLDVPRSTQDDFVCARPLACARAAGDIRRLFRYSIVNDRGRARPPEKPSRGADRDRTDDLRLAKPALSQLSYSPVRSEAADVVWARAELNCRPHAYQACALTT
jgi:hypothetical protein